MIPFKLTTGDKFFLSTMEQRAIDSISKFELMRVAKIELRSLQSLESLAIGYENFLWYRENEKYLYLSSSINPRYIMDYINFIREKML